MADFHAHLANCVIVGQEITHYPDDSWSTNLLPLKLGRARAVLTLQRDIPMTSPSKLVGRQLHTADLVFSGLPEGRRSWAIEVSRDVASLLSFALMSPVSFFGWWHGSRGQGWRAFGEVQHFRPVVQPSDADSVRALVEGCWSFYRRYKRQRKLPEVIRYCVQSDAPNQPIEYKLLGTFVMLENLKATFARANRIPFIRGAFRKPAQASRGSGLPPSYSFAELLVMMFAAAGMKPRLGRLIKLRNEIVHFGLSRRSPDRLFGYYERAHDLVREYLLRICRFEGHYFRYSDPGGRLVRIPARARSARP